MGLFGGKYKVPIMISRLAQIWILIVAVATPSLSAAEINVCVENGAKIIRSAPCKGTAKPIATYKSLAPVVPMQPQRKSVRPIGNSGQTYSPIAQHPFANRRPGVIYGQGTVIPLEANAGVQQAPNHPTSLRPNAYGPGIHQNRFGQPVTLEPQGGGTSGERLQIKPDAYGPGVHMDQYGRPVTEKSWP